MQFSATDAELGRGAPLCMLPASLTGSPDEVIRNALTHGFSPLFLQKIRNRHVSGLFCYFTL